MQKRLQRKKEGFEGQKLIVIPRKIIHDFLTRDPITRPAYITDIGYYPKALFHYMERPAGVSQHIVIYCVEGRGWVTMEGMTIDLSPGEFVTIPAGTPHRYATDAQAPWTIYWIHFAGDTATYITDLLRQGKPRLVYDQQRFRLFDDIYAHLEKGYSNDNLRYVNMIFYHFLSSLLYGDKFSQAAQPQEKDIIDRTMELMQKRSQDLLTLGELADFAGLSVSHFSTLFKKRTGHSPVEYFNHLKIQKACQYLLFTSMTVREIGVMLGIEDQFYFSRMFSKSMGVSPTEYRQRNTPR
ncbi:AraC family transcriptional regulator [Dinghuibacter silviterrae]|nr:AraC family transcriptional regulator [Dinghuibacter silviterrae]